MEQLNNLKQNRIRGRCNATGKTLDRQRGKFQMNLPQRSLARWARQSWVCPFGNAERFGHCMHLGVLQEILREEREFNIARQSDNIEVYSQTQALPAKQEHSKLFK